MNETDGSEDVRVTRVPTERFVAVPKFPGDPSAPPAPDPMRSPPERRRALLLELQGAHPGELFSVQAASLVIGRAGEADIHVVESTASWHHLRLVTRNGGVHAEDLSSMNGTFVNEQRIERSTLLTDGDYVRLGGGGTVFKFCMMEEFEERALRGIFALALRDPLTRLYNAAYFAERLLGELGITQRQGTDLSVVLVNIDHFKTINAQHGHHIGDAVLKLVARSLQTLMRPEDVLARRQNDEFALLIRSTSPRNLEILAERAQKRVSSLAAEAGLGGVPLSVSIGIVRVEQADAARAPSVLMDAARAAVTTAKKLGGNRVALAAPITLAPPPMLSH